MSITWGEFKETVKSKVEMDRSSFVELDSIAYASDFDRTVWRYLGDFYQVARELYVRSVTLTVAEDDIELNLADPAVCSKPLFIVGRLWIGTAEISAYEFDAMQDAFPAPASVPGRPVAWAQRDESVLNFDRALDATTAALTFTVNGFSRNPARTVGSEDDTVLALCESSIDPAAEYCAVRLARPVATGAPGESGRLTGYSQAASEYIMRRAAKQKLAFSMCRRIVKGQADGSVPYYARQI